MNPYVAGICSISGWALALSSLSMPAAASAAEVATERAASGAAADDQGTLESIVVTAQRRSQPINEVGMTISALSADQLAKLGINDIRDLARVVPGMTYAESQKGAPIYTIRGIGFYEESLAASPAVSIYLDQVGFAFPVMAKAATLDVERVEVLKGPQGTLYGQNSTGGAINYVAAKPTDALESGFELGYGRFDATSANGFISGPISETLRARAAVSLDQGGAWQRSYSRRDSNGDLDLLKGRVLLDWTPSDSIDFSLNLNAWRDRSDALAAALYRVTPQTPARVQPSVAAQQVAPERPGIADWNQSPSADIDQDYYQAALQGEFAVTDALTLNSITSYQDFDQDNYRDTDGSALNVFSVHQTGHIESFFQELRASGPLLAERAHWLMGASYAVDDAFEANESFVGLTTSANAFRALGLAPFNSVIAQSDSHIKTSAVFGNFEFKFSDTWSAELGARYTETRHDFAGCLFDVDGNLAAALNAVQSRVKGGLPGQPPVVTIPQGSCATLASVTFDPGFVRSRLDEDNVSWRVGLNWKPVEDTLLFATISQGYKSGSFPNINAPSAVSLSPVVQESVLAYEIGLKTSLARTLQVNVAAFYYDYDDKQLRARVLDPSGVFGAVEALVNVPKSRASGAEASVTWQPFDGLTLNAGGIYLDTEVTKDFRNYDPFGVPVNFKGDPFPFSPEYSLQGSADYEWNLTYGLAAFIGASASYQRPSTSSFGGSPLVEIDSYSLVDARAGVAAADGKWRLTLWAKNILDEYYWTDTFRQVDNTARHVGAPATYGVKISVRY
jgi:iron complex outermembrane recepter protein